MPMFDEVKTLISSHLEELRDNRLPAIQRKTGYSLNRIQDAWARLRKLNPKPGADFTARIAPTVTPDVFLDRQEDGTYTVRLEEGRTPSLRISNYYRKRLMSGEATPEEREFIKRKINAAQWLIESIEQRRNTLTRVSQAVVDHQTRFIEEGRESLEPLKMQQIADKVGVHVTTVSRAVDDKWIQTPRGIYPLKRFFVGGTKSDDGEDVAWDAIRIKLQEVIDQEDKTKPFSDDELVRQLKQHGLNVAAPDGHQVPPQDGDPQFSTAAGLGQDRGCPSIARRCDRPFTGALTRRSSAPRDACLCVASVGRRIVQVIFPCVHRPHEHPAATSHADVESVAATIAEGTSDHVRLPDDVESGLVSLFHAASERNLKR